MSLFGNAFMNKDLQDHGGQSENGSVDADYIAPSLRVLAVPISTLQLAPDNARAHADADLAAIAESLDEHGQLKTVVAKACYRGVPNVVIAGCGTVTAARRLGWTHIAVSWFQGSDDDARAFAIRDNRTAELSRWDSEALEELQAGGVDLLSLWHDDVALADLLRENAPVPRFEPAEAEHRLDELQRHCRTCRCREPK